MTRNLNFYKIYVEENKAINLELPKEKKFKVGMYGGKFLPFHKGHNFCIDVASKLCEKVYVILFYTKSIHEEIAKQTNVLDLELDKRIEKVKEICKQYPNVEFLFIDTSECIFEDGTEDWDAETPLVLGSMGKMDVVFSSEPSYDPYFKRAYPWAKHIVIDEKRITVPISATEIRHMTLEEALKWMV